jgi:5'(3')-deoxyribonucleotidase
MNVVDTATSVVLPADATPVRSALDQALDVCERHLVGACGDANKPYRELATRARQELVGRQTIAELPKITVAYCDVDEVIADWVGPALRLLGHDPATVYAHWDTLDPRPWDVFQVVPRPPKTHGVWDAIDTAGSSFWANLEPFAWKDDLLALLRGFAPTVLLTSPSQHSSSHAGKFEWIQRHFGRTFKDYLLGSCKHRCAHPGALLIDDSPKNCAAFREHGGHAILFPGVGNDLHAIPPAERVAYVATQLMEYRS